MAPRLAPGRAVAGAATGRPPLAGLSPDELTRRLIPRERWAPFPAAADRAFWDEVDAEVREPLIAEGNAQRDQPWAPLPASLSLEYARSGNRSIYEGLRKQRRGRLTALVLAECLEGRQRFLTPILDGIWVTCEESFWGVPAHLSPQKAGIGLPDPEEIITDLFAAETAALLVWTSYLLGPTLDRLSPLIRKRIRVEVDRRVLTPCLLRDDFWWMGFTPGRPHPNNWCPWITHNWLASTLLEETDERRRAASVHKILRCLDQFLDGYGSDGACDEGPGYWSVAGGSLFDSLELLHSASAGAIDLFAT